MVHRTIPAVAALAAFALVGANALAARPDKPDKPDKSMFGKARAPLVRPADGPDDNAKGRIDVQARRNGDDMRVKAQRLAPGSAVDVVIQRLGDDPGTVEVETDFVIAEEVLADGFGANDKGGMQVKLRTHLGDVLPLGAESLADLAGTRVCVRVDSATNDGADILKGMVPRIDSDLPRRTRDKVDLDRVNADDACSGRMRTSFRGKDVRSELRMDVKGLSQGQVVSFRMDDGTGTMVEIGSATANADGEARYRVRTHHGDGLPFDAMTVLDLAGRAVEVWVDPTFVDLTPADPNDALQEVGLCLTGTVPGDG